jgi:hypothetical protein
LHNIIKQIDLDQSKSNENYPFKKIPSDYFHSISFDPKFEWKFLSDAGLGADQVCWLKSQECKSTQMKSISDFPQSLFHILNILSNQNENIFIYLTNMFPNLPMNVNNYMKSIKLCILDIVMFLYLVQLDRQFSNLNKFMIIWKPSNNLNFFWLYIIQNYSKMVICYLKIEEYSCRKSANC